MTMDKPLVSIITATFNADQYLEETIKSVLSQDYPYIEYIVIDGGSTDGTMEIIEKYSERISYWVSEKDQGIYDAWNKGIEAANGNWIAFLGADDIYLPGTITAYVDCLTEAVVKDVDYISSKVNLVKADLSPIRIIGKPYSWLKFRRYMCVAHVGSLHSAAYFRKYGVYDLSYKIVGDYELLLRAGESLRTLFMDRLTVKMRDGGVSNQNKAVFEETYRAKLKNKSRGPIAARIDYYEAKTKYLVRKFLRKIL